MQILVFHGYLLRGTGSNIYTASLAAALVELGHEVHLLCQDRAAGEQPFVDAVGCFDDGGLDVRVLRDPVRCTAYLPDIGSVLPVYVADSYDGFEARRYAELSIEQVEHYLAANVAAVRAVAARAPLDLALANHEVMGGVILARALDRRVGYAVKIHGSALEYTIRPEPARFVPYAREGLEPAGGVLVGSGHTARSLWEVVDQPGLAEKTRLGPPGVNVEAFRPRTPEAAAAGVEALAARLESRAAASFGGDPGASAALRSLEPQRTPVVGYLGKLIVSKGVDLLVAAWPLVGAAVPDARLCMVGFGTFRPGLERLVAALGRADLDGAMEVARAGRTLEDGPAGQLDHLSDFFDSLTGPRHAAYLAAAPRAMGRVHLTGWLEHADLPDILPAFSAQVVPSTFPEAFGMVAAEAAACGVLPVSAAHSGLAEVTATLREALDEDLQPLMAFPLGGGAVDAIAERLVTWLTLDPARRAQAAAALADLARGRYGWRGVGEGVLLAAQGRLDELPEVGAPALP